MVGWVTSGMTFGLWQCPATPLDSSAVTLRTNERQAFDAVLRKQMRFWARLAGMAIVASNLMMALWSDESFRWLLTGLDVVWSIALIRGSSRAGWFVLAGAIAVGQIAVFGWASPGAFILLVAGFAMRFSLRGAVAATIGMWIATAIGLILLGGDRAPGYEMHARDLLFATVNTFVLGALMRSSLASRTRAESLAQQLHAAHDMLRHDLGTNEALAAAQERTRIAHELHDNLGHSLATAHVHTQLARRLVGDGDTELVQAIDQVGLSTRQAMHDLRDAVSLLRQRPGGDMLGQRIRVLLARLPAAVLAHDIVVLGEERALAPAKEFAIYRALQEAMTNIVKHARARAVRVQLEYTPTRVSLDVEDDGVGAAAVRHGFGLRGIADRLANVGGRLEVSSVPGRGFCLHVEVEAQ